MQAYCEHGTGADFASG